MDASARHREPGTLGALPTDRLRRLTRLFHIVLQLQAARPCSLSDLSTACGCSTKTIQRDLSYLEELGIPVFYDRARSSYALSGPVSIPLLDLTLAEATALALSSASTPAAAAAHFGAALETAFSKVLPLVPKEVAEQVRTAQQAFAFQGGQRRDYSRAPVLVLLAAYREQRSVRIDYHSASSGRRSRVVDPYALAYLSGYWMLLAHDHGRGEVRQFALDRVHAAEILPQRFTRPAGWSVSGYMEGSVGVLRGERVEVALRFSREVSLWVRPGRWRFPHTLTPQEDGSVLLVGTVAGLKEILREVLRWGRHVVVEKPPELRRLVAEEAAAVLAHYSETPTSDRLAGKAE